MPQCNVEGWGILRGDSAFVGFDATVELGRGIDVVKDAKSRQSQMSTKRMLRLSAGATGLQDVVSLED